MLFRSTSPSPTAERFPKVIATSHLFDWDRDRLTACGGMSVLDLLLAVLARDHGAELAGAVSEELVVERIREGGERQRIPLQNRLGSSHPKLTQAVLLMEANIEEPLTTDEIAQHVCVSRRQLERIFKQYLNRVPSQYYLELRLNKARQMLMQTSKSIIQIGLSCGFSSGPHFSSAYRNFFGATPREDRNQRRSSRTGSPGDGGTSLSARGFTGQGSVMQLYDGNRMYMGMGTSTFPVDTWSVERVDVLRGPASVLYGEGATGAVINTVPKKPFEGEIENHIRLGYGSNDRQQEALDSGGSLTKSLLESPWSMKPLLRRRLRFRR